jgi:hypothetical protein
MRVRGLVPAAVLALFLAALLASPALAAVSITRAELSGSKLRVEGQGATPNTRVTVNGDQASATSDGSGTFRIEHSNFAAPADCKIVVSDGTTSATATLSGCTPSSSPTPSGPAAPTPLGPSNGASVLVPFKISWSAVTDPTGIAGYNWQVSTTSSFSSLTQRDSTLGTVTEDTVGGLANGTYFWRVQAVNGDLVQGAWSETWSFAVTGAAEGSLAAPTLSLVHGTSFHPFESFGFSWTAVEGASLYILEWSRDSSFPADSTSKIDNIEGTTTGMTIGDFCDGCEQGTYFARVYGIDADRNPGQKSNTVSWTISYDAPLAPPPTPLAPASGATLTLPIELDWSDAPNPQPMGYEVQISRNSSFTDIEEHIPQLTNSRILLLSLTSGTKFWRVRHGQGMASPTLPAFTEWSPASSFTIPNEAPRVQAVWLGGPPCENPCPGADSLAGGQEIEGSIQLTTAAPSGGAVVSLTADNPAAGTFPSSVTIPAGHAFATFRLITGNVPEPTRVTLTGTLGSSSADFVFTVSPPTLRHIMFATDVTGGAPAALSIVLKGKAPPAGSVVSLSSNSPLANPPATATVPEGFASTTVSVPTQEVTTATQVTVSGSLNGSTAEATVTLLPAHPPASLTLDRTSTTGTQGASGVVKLDEALPYDVQIQLTSSHPDIARVPDWVTVPAHSGGGGFAVSTQSPATSTTVTISATGAGVTVTTTLTVDPVGALSGLSLSPTSVTGGNSSTGTVTLGSAAPSGGTSVALSSSTTTVATVPSSITVPAGETSVSFTVSTNSMSSNTSVTISASAGGTTKSATLTVNATSSADSVSISRAEYDGGKGELRVEASSSSSSATLKVYVSATDELIGTLSGGKGQFSWPTNPQNITVRSSLGGSATRAVSSR